MFQQECNRLFIFANILLVIISLFAPKIMALKIIVLFGPCNKPVSSFLHVVRRSIRNNIFLQSETEDLLFKRRISQHIRHDLSDACHWISHETLAVVAVPSQEISWDKVNNSASNYLLPYSEISALECKVCSSRQQGTNHLAMKEIAVFEYLKKEYLHDVIILHEDDDNEGFLLSHLLSTHSVRVSHLQANGFLRKMKQFFNSWNLADLTDEGRLLISLGVGNTTDQLLKRLVRSSMHNIRTKLLVSDCPQKWQEILFEVKAYEIDLVVISPQLDVILKDCPLALEVLPTGSHSHKHEEACSPLSARQRMLGQTILMDIDKNLQNKCCSSGVEEYTVWKSFPSENGTQSLKPVALWADDAGGLIRMEPIDLQTITIRIAVLQYQPFISLNISDDGEITLEDCVLKEILRYVSGRLKFKYRLVLAPSNDWGTKVDKVWRGAIGMVIRGEADAIPYLTVTPNRFEIIEYTKPLSSVYYGLLIAFPEEPPRVLIFLRLYAKEVWLLLVSVGLLLSILLSWMQKRDTTARESRILSSFSRCSWVIFGALLQQGSTCLPVTTSGRVLMSTWWLAVLILTTTYSANLIAVLAFPGIKFVVKSLEDMVNHDSIKLVIKEGCPVLEDLQESDIELYERVRKTFLENPRRSKIMDTVEERCCAIDDVIAKKSVYIDDYNYLQWMVDEDYKKENRCRITIPPYEFSRMDLAVGLRRGSFLLPLLNQEIQLMKENGVLDHWYSKYTPNREECYQMEQVLPGQREVRVEDLQGPFFLLLLSFIAGILTLIAETLYKKYSARCRGQISDRYSQNFKNTNPF